MPTIDRRRVGALLREWREERKIKSKDAAAHLRIDATMLGRIERGESVLTRDKISSLMGLYGVQDPAALEELVRAATEDPSQQWWHPYRHQVPQAYLDFIALEDQAISIQVSSGLTIPGLLQSPEYAHEMHTNVHFSEVAERIDTLVSIRMTRQQVITRALRSARLEAVFFEAALMGPEPFMSDQIRHLVGMSKRPNVDIRVVTFDAHLSARLAQPAQVLDFCHPWSPVVHLDSPFGGSLDEDPNAVSRAKEMFWLAQNNALPADETREFLEAQLRKIEQ